VKAVRLLQIVIVLAAGAYLLLLHDMNSARVALPFLFSLPPAVALLFALILGWLLGWLPATIRGVRRTRELKRLRQRVSELEQETAGHTPEDFDTPVIPDRTPAETEEQEAMERHENL
jgi:uncharacterized integral membrane protein